jgi:hypothetical protein
MLLLFILDRQETRSFQSTPGEKVMRSQALQEKRWFIAGKFVIGIDPGRDRHYACLLKRTRRRIVCAADGSEACVPPAFQTRG